MSTLFIWGAGGVGKTHMAIRKAALSKPPTLLITLDPSSRVYDLLEVPRDQIETEVHISNSTFTLKRADQNKLFESLSAKKPSHPKVRFFYNQMVKGLQDFRDYLTLIQLADELMVAEFESIVIDTPPFQEAMGLHRSLFNLRQFFEKSLVQLALRSANMSWIHGTLRRIFEVVRIFSGKKAAEQIFDFIDWLTSHTERFSLSAKFLEELVFSKKTKHLFIVTPETSTRFLEEVRSFFGKSANLEFTMNRSLQKYELPQIKDSFIEELASLKSLEIALRKEIEQRFKKSEIEKIPLMLMGEDTREELQRFIKTTS